MASALQKLLKKSSATRIITSFHTSQSLNPLKPLPLHRSPFFEIHGDCHRLTVPSPIVTQDLVSSRSTVIFPSFPFGFASNPILASGFCSSETEDVGFDDSGKIWADSVKKKRKRKMNKHKYQKLRKRTRRQS